MSSISSIGPDNFTAMKNNSDCDFCSLEDCFIGINDFEVPEPGGASYKPEKKKKKITNELSKNDNANILIKCQQGSKVQFKMGNGKYTEDIEEAKDYLMERNYAIQKLKMERKKDQFSFLRQVYLRNTIEE